MNLVQIEKYIIHVEYGPSNTQIRIDVVHCAGIPAADWYVDKRMFCSSLKCLLLKLPTFSGTRLTTIRTPFDATFGSPTSNYRNYVLSQPRVIAKFDLSRNRKDYLKTVQSLSVY